jgi:GNAT superfamily N-acetyltransferase
MSLRRFIQVIESAQRADLANLVQAIRDSVAPDFAGHCEGAARDLADLLHQHGLAADFVEGRFDAPWDWYENGGDTHPWTPHCWVETADLILDPSAEQFGERPLIVQKGTPAAQPYDATPLMEEAGDQIKKAKGVRTPLFTKDGRRIVMRDMYMGVYAYVDGKEAGHMHIVCPHGSSGYENYFVVGRLWVHEPFRGQGIATAMYDYAYRAGYRPLRQSKTLTDGGQGVWQKHIDRKRALGLDQESHSDHPNRFYWRPLPPQDR